MRAHSVDSFGVAVCGNDEMRAAVKYGICGVEPWNWPGSSVANADVAERDGPVLLRRARHKQSEEHCSSCHQLNRHCMLAECSKGQASAHTHGSSCLTSHAKVKGAVKQGVSLHRPLLTLRVMQHSWSSMYTCTHTCSAV